MKKIIPIRQSIYVKTYVWNLLLIFIAISICLLAADRILPAIAKESSKFITDTTVDRLSSQITSFAEELDILSQGIQNNPVFQSANPSEISNEIQRIIQYSPLIDDVLVINPNGHVLDVYPDTDGTLKRENFSDREYIQKTIETRSIHYSEVFMAQTGEPAIVVGIPILKKQDGLTKIVALRIRLIENHMIDSLFQHFDLGDGGYMYLVDQKGKIIYHPVKERVGTDGKLNPIVQDLIVGKSGYREVTNTKGIEMYASYRFIPRLGWGIVAQIPVESTYYALHKLKEKVWNYSLIFLIPTILVLALYTRRMTQPLKRLYEAVNEVVNGNFEHYIQTIGKSEIGVISRRFNEMIDYIRIHRENLQQKKNELYQQQSFLRQIMDTDPNFIYARDSKGTYTLVNKARAQYFGRSMDEIIGKNELDVNACIVEAKDSLRTDKQVFDSKEGLFIPEYPITDLSGNLRYIQIHKIPILNTEQQVDQVLCVANDITELKQKEKEIQYQAFHDSLTGLPNRLYFEDQLTEAIQIANKQKEMALIFLDLDHFKHINDSLGHSFGDLLLKQVSERLCHFIPEPNLVSRMGGDEFTILLPDIKQENLPAKIANQIIESFAEPFFVENREFYMTTSMGISIYPKDGTSVDALLKNADLAMYQAKKMGKNTYQLFNDDMSKAIWERLTIEASMRRALDQDEFFVVYQPKYDIQQNKISGMEALLRWDCPHLGMIPPDKFIPIAEDMGFILPLGAWVLKEACIQNKKWLMEGYPAMRVAVNISAKQLMDPHFLNIVEQTLEQSNLDPRWLELEITESTLMQCSEDIIRSLHRLKEKGIFLSIDDFGTGYSSLSYLKQFPVHSLKIDRSFIRELDENNKSIIRAVIALSKSLKLKVTAEGVEMKNQIDFLRMEKCDEIQGYHISKPVPAGEFSRLLDRYVLSLHTE